MKTRLYPNRRQVTRLHIDEGALEAALGGVLRSLVKGGSRRQTTTRKSPAAAPTAASSRPSPAAVAACKRFVAAFGAQGAVWFSEGKSFEECQPLAAKQSAGRQVKSHAAGNSGMGVGMDRITKGIRFATK